jgi:hypothetical protein
MGPLLKYRYAVSVLGEVQGKGETGVPGPHDKEV